jgi:putative peptide zinc metalloprotease protein
MEFSLKKIVETNEVRFLLLGNNDKHFTISEILYDILNCYKQTANSEYIYGEISKKYQNQNVSKNFIDKTLASVFEKLNTTEASTNLDAISHKFVLVKEGQFQRLYSGLSNLHNKYVMGLVILISLLSTVFFFNELSSLSLTQLYRFQLSTFSIYNLLIIYCSFLIIILWHEIGHATASVHFGVQPKEIGFGFYFIFPVFFTNVTNIWQLNRISRNVVNFGGIYFQLIVNILLISLLYFGMSKPLLFPLILINLASIVSSLNPFFRYDGYWIFSDYFSVPNLKAKSKEAFLKCMKGSPIAAFRASKEESKTVLIYSFLNMIFWVFVYYYLCVFVYNNITNLYLTFQDSQWLQNQATIIDTVLSLTSTIIIIYLIVVQCINNSKLFKK